MLYLAVAQNRCLIFRIIVAYKFGSAFLQCNPVSGFNGGGIACTLLLLLHFGIELFDVGGHAVFAEDKFGEVERKAERIIERKGIFTADFGLAGCLGIRHGLIQQTDTGLQSTEERIFFFFNDFGYQFFLCIQLGVCAAHVLDEYGQQLVHESLLLSEERVAVAHCTAEDTADYVTCLGIARKLTVGDGESDCTDVVGNYAHGDVLLFVFAVCGSRHIADGFQYRLENIGVVVGSLALQCTYQAFKAHTGVDYFGGKSFEAAVCLAVELHEYKVPYLDNLRMVFVHQLRTGYFGLFFFRT